MRKSNAILAGLFLMCGGLCSGITGWLQPHYTWNACGPFQIVAGPDPDEMWCFVQLDRWVRRPGWLVEPPSITLGHEQEVIVIAKGEIKKRIKVSIPDGVSFHPNISTIYRLNDEFFLYEKFSMNIHRSIFIWQTDHFELLPLQESEAFLKSEGLDALGPGEIEKHPRLNESQRAPIDSRWIFEPVSFAWNGAHCEVELIQSGDTKRLQLRRTDEPPWTVDLIEYDTTRKVLSNREHRALWDRPQQYGNPRNSAVGKTSAKVRETQDQ